MILVITQPLLAGAGQFSRKVQNFASIIHHNRIKIFLSKD